MIYITGDMHGDAKRFKSKAVRKLKKGDTLIVCGDFGFLWDDSKREKKLLRWIGKRRFQTLFIEGTHDNMDLLEKYPAYEWCGGVAREISGNLKYLCRGHIFTIEGSAIFAFGGGESNDSDTRTRDVTWWARELPTAEEIAGARARLEQAGWKVDYIVTHDSSRKIKKLLTMEEADANILDTFFDEVREKCGYVRWYFGSLHRNKAVHSGDMALFTAVVPVTANKL